MINDPVNNFQIKLLKGPDSFISFALSKKFDERLSLTRPGRRTCKELQKQWVWRVVGSASCRNTSQRIGRLAFSNIMSQRRIVFEVFFGAFGAGHLLCEPVGKIKVGW